MKSTWRKSALSYQNGKETLYRVHGTSEPWTIGAEASWGGIRMINKYVIELYDRAVRHTRGRYLDCGVLGQKLAVARTQKLEVADAHGINA
jgi:hypothetical protein